MAKKPTAGQKLWLSLRDASLYEEMAATLADGTGKSPEAVGDRWSKRWHEGMSRHLREAFPERFRTAREKAGITQEKLAGIADLSITAVAMIERGERVANLDTAARICWALDVASGVTLEQLS